MDQAALLHGKAGHGPKAFVVRNTQRRVQHLSDLHGLLGLSSLLQMARVTRADSWSGWTPPSGGDLTMSSVACGQLSLGGSGLRSSCSGYFFPVNQML